MAFTVVQLFYTSEANRGSELLPSPENQALQIRLNHWRFFISHRGSPFLSRHGMEIALSVIEVFSMMKYVNMVLIALFAVSAQANESTPAAARALSSEGTGLEFACSSSESDGWISKEIGSNGQGKLLVPFGRGKATVTVLSGADVKDLNGYVVVIRVEDKGSPASVSGSLGAKDSYGNYRPVILNIGNAFISCQLEK